MILLIKFSEFSMISNLVKLMRFPFEILVLVHWQFKYKYYNEIINIAIMIIYSLNLLFFSGWIKWSRIVTKDVNNIVIEHRQFSSRTLRVVGVRPLRFDKLANASLTPVLWCWTDREIYELFKKRNKIKISFD